MLSTSEQIAVQQLIDSSTPVDLEIMRHEAERTLALANMEAGARILSSPARKAVNYAVEVLTHLDATRCGGGWWYRAKRRTQIIAMYLDN